MTILVDTSARIGFDHPRGSERVKAALADALTTHDVATTTGTRGEQDYRKVLADLSSLLFLAITPEAAQRAAELGWLLAREGRSVPTIDLLIAGATRVHQAEVWHFGDEHFSQIAAAGGPPEHSLQSPRR